MGSSPVTSAEFARQHCRPKTDAWPGPRYRGCSFSQVYVPGRRKHDAGARLVAPNEIVISILTVTHKKQLAGGIK
jgi:hypothetical protein